MRHDSFTWCYDNDKLEEMHKYFLQAKLMDQEEFRIWRVLKMAMQEMNDLTDPQKEYASEKHGMNFMKCLSALEACEKSGIPSVVIGELLLATEL